jgi:hypothetical protein
LYSLRLDVASIGSPSAGATIARLTTAAVHFPN